jgi:hypothetical protein
MKKLTTALLGLSLAIGCVTPTFADDARPKKVKKQKKNKKRKAA